MKLFTFPVFSPVRFAKSARSGDFFAVFFLRHYRQIFSFKFVIADKMLDIQGFLMRFLPQYLVKKSIKNTISCDFPIDLCLNIWYTDKATRELGGDERGAWHQHQRLSEADPA